MCNSVQQTSEGWSCTRKKTIDNYRNSIKSKFYLSNQCIRTFHFHSKLEQNEEQKNHFWNHFRLVIFVSKCSTAHTVRLRMCCLLWAPRINTVAMTGNLRIYIRQEVETVKCYMRTGVHVFYCIHSLCQVSILIHQKILPWMGIHSFPAILDHHW
jgi:hypothetical protein